MKSLILVPLIAAFGLPIQKPIPSQPDSQVVVLGFKLSRAHGIPKQPDPAQNAPPALAPEMIPQNRNYARQARANDQQGARDPNEDTIDGRSAAIEKIVQQSRTPKAEAVDNYTYTTKIQNTSQK